MIATSRLGGFLILALLYLPWSALEDGILLLYVSNTAEEQVKNITLTCKGGCSQQSPDQTGRVRLKLPPQTKPGEAVTLSIARLGGPDWVLISPWDGRVVVPSFAEKADNFVSIVVARRGDKQILGSGKALELITARMLKEVALRFDRQLSDEERQLVFKQQAEAVGLPVEEVDRAIRAWAGKAKDPYQLGLAALYVRDYSEATAELTKSYQMSEANLEKVQKETFDRAFFLGRALFEQQKYAQAARIFRRALELRPEDSATLYNLGMSLVNDGAYLEAEVPLKKALAIREMTLGQGHPDVADTLSVMAINYYNQDKKSDAEVFFKRALSINERARGKEHPETATCINNLAMVYFSRREYAMAKPLFEQSMAIREKALGAEHPDLANSINNLANLYLRQKKYAEAEPLYKRALDIREKKLPPGHSLISSSLGNLADLYQEEGRYAEAEPLYLHALDVREKALGKEHPDMVFLLNKLANFYLQQKKYVEAEPLYKRALDIREKKLPPGHSLISSSLGNLANLFREEGKYTEAESLYIRALDVREKALGKEHPDLAPILENYATLLRKMSREDEANKLAARAQQIREKLKSRSDNR